METVNKYVVRAETKEGSDSLDLELASATSSPNIPDREVEVLRKRKENPVMTDWLLTDEEALVLEKDERVKYVKKKAQYLTVDADTIEETLGYSYDEGGAYPYSRTYSDHVIVSSTKDIRNYGLHAHSIPSHWDGDRDALHSLADLPDYTIPEGKSSAGDVYEGSDQAWLCEKPFKQKHTGKGVDVIIMDTGFDCEHPEWLGSDNISRLQKIDWFTATGVQGSMPSDFYTGTDSASHGTHVASIAAGKKHGWAKDAHIYCINLTSLIEQDAANGINTAFELVEAFCRQNTNGRPKVVNMSFMISPDYYGNYNRKQQVAGGTYRGSAWSNPFMFDWNSQSFWDYENGTTPIPDPRNANDTLWDFQDGSYTTYNMSNNWLGFSPVNFSGHQNILHINYSVPRIFGQEAFSAPYEHSHSVVYDPDRTEDTPSTAINTGFVGVRYYNAVDRDLTEINDLVDTLCDYAHVCIAAGNDGRYLTVEDNAHITTDRYEGDPSADWDNTVYEFVKDTATPWDGEVYEVNAMPNEEGDNGVEKREYYYNRPQPPYSPKSNYVGWLQLPKPTGNQSNSLKNYNTSKANYKSNYGSAVNCWAHGEHIVAGISKGRIVPSSSLITGEYSQGSEYRYEAYSGTSMASPQVAGITACYAEVYPDLSPSELKAKIQADSKQSVSGRFPPSKALSMRNNNWVKLFNATDSSQVYANPEYLQFYSSNPTEGATGWDGYYNGSFNEADVMWHDRNIPFYPWRHQELKIENKLTINSGAYGDNSVLSTPTSPAIWYQPVELEVQLRDENDDVVDSSSLPLEFTSTRGQLSAVTYDNGLYKATYTPEYEAYDETIEVYLYGSKVGNTLQFTTEAGAPPQITSSNVVSIPEDAIIGDEVLTITSDYGLTYFILGSDKIYFNLDATTGRLTLNTALDFATKPIYNLILGTYAYNITSPAHALTVVVTDAIPPVISLTNIDVVDATNDTYETPSGSTVVRYTENTHIDQRITTISVSDNSGVTPTVSLRSDSHSAFYLNGNDVYISEMDYEASALYQARIVATDAEGNDVVKTLMVMPYDVDDTPPIFNSSAIANAIQEHTQQNAIIHTVNAYDAGGVSYSISNDHGFTGWLSINSTSGQITLLQDVEYDDTLLVASNRDILVTVTATDAAGNSTNQVITISILERDHTAPIITSGLATSATLDENNVAGVAVHTVTANETVTFENQSNDGLVINSTTGVITLPLVADYETKNSYYISYRVRDTAGNVSAVDSFTLNINDVFEDVTAPIITSANPATVSFNEFYHGVLHQVIWTEEYSTATITKTGGDLNIASNGQVTSTDPLDYEASTSHYVEYDITDEAGNTTSGRVNVNVGDVDDFPVISNSIPSGTTVTINSVLTNEPAGFMSADKNVSWSFLKDDGTYATTFTKNNTTFTIAQNGNVTMTTNGYIDVVGWNTVYGYTVAATADDDGQVTHGTYTYNIAYTYYGQLYTDYTSFNDSTGTLTVSIPENTSLDNVVGSITVKDYMDEPIQDECTFTITSGDLSGKFTWDDNELKLSGALDYETKTSYSGNVLISHPTAIDKTVAMEVTITNIDEVNPVFSNGSSHTLSAIDENTGNNTQIYGAYATDQGDGTSGTVTYSLNTDASYNSDKLTINPSTGQVFINANTNISYAGNYLNNHVLEFKVIATDDAGNTAEQLVGLPITQITPNIQRATGGNNDTYHVTGNTFEIDADVESNRIAVYSVTNVTEKGITNNDVTFSISGETTDVSIQHQAGTDYVIIHNFGSAFDGTDPQKVITLTCTFSDGASTNLIITLNVNAAAHTGYDLTSNWHSVTTKTTTTQSDNYSVVEIPYANSTAGNLKLFLEHKATATSAWGSDFCIGLVQILNTDGSIFKQLKPEIYQWLSASYNSSTTQTLSASSGLTYGIISSVSGSTNGGLGKFYLGSSTPSGTTGANDGINTSTYASTVLPVGDDTVAQSSGANYLYRECSSPVAHDYVNYCQSQSITYLPQNGFIRIAYLNCGTTGLDGTDSLRIAFQ